MYPRTRPHRRDGPSEEIFARPRNPYRVRVLAAARSKARALIAAPTLDKRFPGNPAAVEFAAGDNCFFSDSFRICGCDVRAGEAPLVSGGPATYQPPLVYGWTRKSKLSQMLNNEVTVMAAHRSLRFNHETQYLRESPTDFAIFCVSAIGRHWSSRDVLKWLSGISYRVVRLP